MIHVITARNRAPYKSQLEQMFRLRHEIYVKERGWTALESEDGLEMDDYDDERTIYCLAIDDSGEVLGGLRLYPTTGPHLLLDHFPNLVDGEIPRGPDIYELTRYFIAPNRRDGGRPIRGELMCAMFEFAMARQLTSISLTCDTFFLPGIIRTGWKVRHLGVPADYDEGSAMAVLIPVDQEHLNCTRDAFEIDHPTLFVLPEHLAPETDFPMVTEIARLFDAMNRIEDAQSREAFEMFLNGLADGDADFSGGVERIADLITHPTRTTQEA